MIFHYSLTAKIYSNKKWNLLMHFPKNCEKYSKKHAQIYKKRIKINFRPLFGFRIIFEHITIDMLFATYVTEINFISITTYHPK